MRYFSMFSGIGGFEYGIEKADNKRTHISEESEQEECEEGGKWYTDERGALLCSRQDSSLCVGFSEIDRYATAIYRYHYPSHRNFGDATKINPDDIPDFDLLVGGFPCQSFSIAGKRKGFQDIRGTLFEQIVRIAKAKRPRLLLLENVKGLLSSDDGRCFATIISSLAELGYSVEWEVLNSKNFGVPQNRERVFIVGHLGDGCAREVFPVGKGDAEYNERTQDISSAIDANYWKGGASKGFGAKERQQISVVGNLNSEGGCLNPSLDKEGNVCAIDGNYFKGCGTRGNKMRAVANDNSRIRRLTPTECERLQGFEDSWTKFGIDENGNKFEVSDSQRYKCLGNAVTTNVVTAIVEKINQTAKTQQ